jgi:hypothetical protein
LQCRGLPVSVARELRQPPDRYWGLPSAYVTAEPYAPLPTLRFWCELRGDSAVFQCFGFQDSC